jgi:hypothetical protein
LDVAPDLLGDIADDASDDAQDAHAESCEVGCTDCCGEGRACMDFGTNVCGEAAGRCASTDVPCPALNSPTIGLTTCDGHCSWQNLCQTRRSSQRTAGRQYLCLQPPPTQVCDLDASSSECPEGETCIATACEAGVCTGGCYATEELLNDVTADRVCATSTSSPFQDTGECWENAADAWASGYNGLLYVPEETRYQ